MIRRKKAKGMIRRKKKNIKNDEKANKERRKARTWKEDQNLKNGECVIGCLALERRKENLND